jgi:hypothetical protein
MTELMMVQQLAGCYWKLAKVWTHETEAAWRARAGLVMPLEEVAEWGYREDQLMIIRNRVMQKQKDFFSTEKLRRPTIPTGATARTILRYQASLNTTLFRCLSFLERRSKERIASEEAFEEHDYINEPTEAAAPPKELEPAAPATETSAEKPAEPAKDAELHKRTQKDAADAQVSSEEEVNSILDQSAADAAAEQNRAKTP